VLEGGNRLIEGTLILEIYVTDHAEKEVLTALLMKYLSPGK
jgi:hypothetical protein